MKRIDSLKKTVFILLIVLLVFCLQASIPVFAAEDQEKLSTKDMMEKGSSDTKKEFSYNPVGKRDPFEPLVSKEKQAGGKPEKEKGPLEKFELSQFRLMAMLLVKGTPRAMVKAPDGKSYIVKPGDKIGKLDGEIEKIETKVLDPVSREVVSPDRIVIKEVGYDPYNNKEVVEYRYITM